MNSMTWSVHLVHVNPAGKVTVVVCGAVNAAEWSKTPSARTGNTGGLWTGALPQGVSAGVTGGSGGRLARSGAMAIR
jgi:hypothetical protein